MTEEKKIETALKQSYARWQQLYANGGSDPRIYWAREVTFDWAK